jgi:anti-sigma-K factor RskA
MIDQGHIEDQAAARALGALPPEEEAHVDRHVEVCPPCREMLRESEEVASLLALTVQPARPSQHCKERLMALIEREPQARTAKRTARMLQTAPIMVGSFALPAWAFRAAGAAALLALLVWNISLQRQIAHTRMIQTMVVTDHQPIALKPQGVAGNSVTARMFQGENGSDAVLVIENLPPPPRGKVYQVWVANETQQRPMDTFQIGHKIEQVLMRPGEPLSKYKWVMITVEDAGGSQTPSETTVLFGDL